MFTDVGMDTVASDFVSFRDLKLKKINPDKAEYSFMATIDSKNQEGLIVFFYDREWNDVWLIDSVGF